MAGAFPPPGATSLALGLRMAYSWSRYLGRGWSAAEAVWPSDHSVRGIVWAHHDRSLHGLGCSCIRVCRGKLRASVATRGRTTERRVT